VFDVLLREAFKRTDVLRTSRREKRKYREREDTGKKINHVVCMPFFIVYIQKQ